MKARVCLTLLLFLLLFCGCEKDFNINTQAGSEVVINSLWNDGGPMTVYVTKPYAVGASALNITSIPDARVELYEDNVFKEVLHYLPSDTLASFGAYLSTLVPKAGKNYVVKTHEAKYQDASAGDRVPVAAQIITNALEQYVDTGAQAAIKVMMVFRDNPDEQNYYRINVWIYGKMMTVNSAGDTSYSYPGYAMKPFPLNSLNDTVRDGDFLLFSDRGFNGQEKSLELTFKSIDRQSFVYLILGVELHTVSYAHYKYFQTLNLYRSTNSSHEPVYVYSNVTNGLGAFVAEHVQSMIYEVK